MNPQIEHNFKYHPPRGDAAQLHGAIRSKAQELAALIDQSLPPGAGREKATAITKCEEAMMWACAGIARHSATESHRDA
jgi:hypothetical protein